MNSDSKFQKDLPDLIRKYGDQGKEISKIRSEYQKYGQYASDLSEGSLEVVNNFTKYSNPSDVSLNKVYETFDYASRELKSIIDTFHGGIPTASTAIANTVLAISPTTVHPEFISSVIHLADIVDKQDNNSKVIQLMKQYQLNIPKKGQRSALELFDTAWKAFETPVDPDSPASTCLLPMR